MGEKGQGCNSPLQFLYKYLELCSALLVGQDTLQALQRSFPVWHHAKKGMIRIVNKTRIGRLEFDGTKLMFLLFRKIYF
tara:strand:- start:1903 stop:2139 length:237 start_codon:yes stop_codon:yes gene_type:complete